jgi:ABC-type transport system involved in multi-copper enzyme maturation permease subunit
LRIIFARSFSITKAWLIATRLLWQNRWLFFLLMLWPYVMAAILSFGGQPDPDDVLWMLHQECFAGLALVAVTGSTLLSNEQRSRRIIMVLSRAFSRPQYLLSLLITAWLPLVLYVSGFVISGIFMANLLHKSYQGIVVMAVAQLVLGIWAGAISIFWSILLPQILASIISVGCIGLAVYLGELRWIGPGRLLLALFQTTISGKNTPITLEMDAILTILAAAVWFTAATWLFKRRDLNLLAD